MPSQTDSHGKIIHNKVLNYEPILMDYQPFPPLDYALLDRLKYEWYKDKPYISIDGITSEEALSIILAYVNTTEFLDIIRKYIRSNLFFEDSQATFEKYLKFEREFKVIDKQKLLSVLNDPSSINSILTSDEIQILKEQSIFRNIIDNVSDILTGNDLNNAIKYNLYFYEKSSSYYSLYQSGVVDKIKDYIGSGTGNVDESQVITIVKKELENLLKTQVFLSYDLIQQVINDPLNIGNLLTYEQFETVMYRAATSLNFISLEDINAVKALYQSGHIENIKDIFSTDEIKLMMENEINEKKIISNMLTFEQVTNYFNDLKTQFFGSDFLDVIDITNDDIDKWINEVTI